MLAGLGGCGSDGSGAPERDPEPPAAIGGVQVKLSFEAEAGFFDAPFPVAHRARVDGSLRVADLPNPQGNEILSQIVSLLEEGSTGFSLNADVFLPFDGRIDASRLPGSPAESMEATSPVFLVDVSPESPELGRRLAIEASFKEDAETYSPQNLLAIQPFQGFVLRPETTYAAVVLRSLGAADGEPLGSPLALEQLKRGIAPEGQHGASAVETFDRLWSWMKSEGLDPADVAAATVFTTGNPTRELVAFRDQVRALPVPSVDSPMLVDEYAEYCVVSARLSLPEFQKGPKPYQAFGTGQLVLDDQGQLVVQERTDVELILTIPAGAMPADGWPLVLYGTGAAGKPRQVVDRTETSMDPDAGLGPTGQGPALHFARRGVAALGFPPPLAWDRHPNGSGGTLDFWNVGNLGAFRDNVRQGILDFTTLIEVAKSVELDAALCPGATTSSGTFRYDPSRLLMYGHSNGSTIGGAVIPLHPDLRAGMLSGAGGSWVHNLVLAEAPIVLRDLVGVLLGYEPGDEVDVHDVPIALFQTAMESVEMASWGRHVWQEPLAGNAPKDLLLIEGLIDPGHFPRMVNSYAMSVGMDVLEPTSEETAAAEYALVGRGGIAAPASANSDAEGRRVTTITVQRDERPGTDGHIVPFEWPDLKYQYSCFAWSALVSGTATVPGPNPDPMAACP